MDNVVVGVSYIRAPINVTYRRYQKEWMCTALQFDLVGFGKTRQEAFQDMKSLVNEYLLDALATEEKVRLYNPSDSREWKIKDQKKYRVLAIIAREKEKDVVPDTISDLPELKQHFRGRLRGIDLKPATSRLVHVAN